LFLIYSNHALYLGPHLIARDGNALRQNCALRPALSLQLFLLLCLDLSIDLGASAGLVPVHLRLFKWRMSASSAETEKRAFGGEIGSEERHDMLLSPSYNIDTKYVDSTHYGQMLKSQVREGMIEA
jgi:hypothetical protein